MPLATLVRADGSRIEREVPQGCLTVVVPESHNEATADDLLDMGLMGRIRERTFRLAAGQRGPRGGRVFEEVSVSKVIEVRRTWPL